MITAENLKKNFGTTSVINDISLEINQGEFIGIMGESGSGKSTLLYLLSGLLTPTSGKVFVKKDEITSMNDTRLSNFRTSNFGFIFQFHNLIQGLTVVENMELPLILARKNPKNYSDMIKELLERVGLKGHENKLVEELSGGQQQRVAIARSLINDPSILFADEPTGSLDSENTDNIVNLLGEINKEQNVTIIMVTHSNKTLIHCNRVIDICDGRVM